MIGACICSNVDLHVHVLLWFTMYMPGGALEKSCVFPADES